MRFGCAEKEGDGMAVVIVSERLQSEIRNL